MKGPPLWSLVVALAYALLSPCVLVASMIGAYRCCGSGPGDPNALAILDVMRTLGFEIPPVAILIGMAVILGVGWIVEGSLDLIRRLSTPPGGA